MTRLGLGVDGKLALLETENGEPPCATSTAPVTLTSASVSQVLAWKRCVRRWFFRSVRKVKAPEQTQSRSQGREGHSLIEHYYKTGTIPVGHPQERRVRAAVEHLPKPSPAGDIHVEHKGKIQLEEGLPPFYLVIDWVNLQKPGVTQIVDHKFTKRFNERLEKPIDVTNDEQMLTYAEYSFRELPENDVEVAHNTISTAHVARVAPLVFTRIERKRANENWEGMIEVIRKMVTLASAPPADWNDVPGNTEACGDFGGCDYLPICALKTPTIGVGKNMAHDEASASNLLARLKAQITPTAEPEIIRASLPDTATEVNVVGAVPLLPPDAPSRMTPPEEEAVEKPKKGRKTKAVTERPRYEYDMDEKMTRVELPYLNERGEDGWELVGFHDGITAVFRRLVIG
jgi:hypothetical protein